MKKSKKIFIFKYLFSYKFLLSMICAKMLMNEIQLMNAVKNLTFFNRKNSVVMSSRYTQQICVQEMKQSGFRGHLLSTVPRVIATSVYRTKTVQSC